MLTVFVLCAINLLNFYDRQAPGALLEPIRKEFGLTDTMIGLLGSLFVWVYALVGLPLGRLADVWSRKKLLALGLAVWSALTAASGLAVRFPVLLVSRLGVGVGEAACGPVGISWIGDLFPPEKRTRVLSLFSLGVPVGGALSFLLCGPIAQRWGWRTAMVSAAAPALLLLPMLLLLKEPARGAAEINTSERKMADATKAPTAVASLLLILRIPTLWWIIASGALLNFNLYALGTFLPTFMTRVHGYSIGRAGLATGIVYLLAGISGGLLGGQLGDRVPLAARNRRLSLAAAAALFAAPVLFYGIRQRPAADLPALIAIGLAYAAFNTYFSLVYASIQDIVAPRLRGFTIAVYSMALYLCGAAFGPLITGGLSDYFARRAMHAAGAVSLEAFRGTGLQQAMLVMPVLSVALALVLYMGSRTMNQDIAYRDRNLQEVTPTSVPNALTS